MQLFPDLMKDFSSGMSDNEIEEEDTSFADVLDSDDESDEEVWIFQIASFFLLENWCFKTNYFWHRFDDVDI